MPEESSQRTSHLPTIAAIIIVAVVGLHVFSIATSPQMTQYVEKSEEWCSERNGELVNSRVVGSHGGLHCNLPNGTSVHMSEVIEVNQSDAR